MPPFPEFEPLRPPGDTDLKSRRSSGKPAIDMTTLGYSWDATLSASVPGAVEPNRNSNDIRKEKGWFSNSQGGKFYREGGEDYTDETKRTVINTLEANMSLRGENGEWINPAEQNRKEQYNILKEEKDLQEELEPFILSGMGLQRDPVTGKITALPPVALTPDQIKENELEALYKEHLTAAQEGRLPVSLATTDLLSRQEQELDESMSRRLGTKWKESTPGATTAGDYLLSSEAIKEAERHDDLNKASSLLNTRQASISDIQQRALGGLQGMGSPSYSLANSYGNANQPYLFKNLLNVRMQNQEAADKAVETAGIYGLIGTGIGAGTYYGYDKYSKPDNDPNYNPSYNSNTDYWTRK